jgi:uncharacterized protein YcbK (DUF882 family)
MQPDFLERLDMARMLANVPFSLQSAVRCPEHNKAVGGLQDSAHLSGWAVDIEARSAVARMRVVYGLIKAGVNRIGVYSTFVHADGDPTKPSNVMWVG